MKNSRSTGLMSELPKQTLVMKDDGEQIQIEKGTKIKK